MKTSIPFGRTRLVLDVPDGRLLGILKSRLSELKSARSETEIVRESLDAPIGSPKLSELAKGRKRIVIITSDHTRPVPSRVTLPPLLEEIRKGSPDADIRIVIATGCHRAMTEEELRDRFGPDVCERESFLVHDCADDGVLVNIGKLPSGGDCILNKVVLDADLLVSEGFIEPHFFAGFSGGRKAVLPGCASRVTVLANHCAEFIASDRARTGILDGNPIHNDMLFAMREAKLAFILNVVLDADKKVVASFAGDADKAHRKGCAFFESYGAVSPVMADIVVTSNGGYPLDQNIYQAVKCMTAAEASCNGGGVIIVASECADGHGGEDFLHAFEEIASPSDLMKAYLARLREATEPDQWQIQILCRILMKFMVIMVTGPGAPREMIERLNMRWADSLASALTMAEAILGKPDAKVTVIPDGIGVIVKQ